MLGFDVTIGLIFGLSGVGLLWALLNLIQVSSIEVKEENANNSEDPKAGEKIKTMIRIGETISQVNALIFVKRKGADAFLYEEYKIVGIFSLFMAIVIKFGVDGANSDFGTTAAFVAGCVTSVLCGYLGMRIAVYSNYRTAYMAQTSLAEAFRVAFRAGCVMGFSLTSLSLIVLTALILIYRSTYAEGLFDLRGTDVKTVPNSDLLIASLYEAIAGYGLGGSTIALFGRVGGGIYTKAADVGADLVGKTQAGLAEDSPYNPATIADNVGDNVGDIAGMGADLFGSFAEATCAGLVILASSPYQRTYAASIVCPDAKVICADADVFLFYPLLLSAFGIAACVVCAFFGSFIFSVDQEEKIEATLRYQLIISAGILAITLYGAAWFTLDTETPNNSFGANGPSNFLLVAEAIGGSSSPYNLTVFNAYICSFTGLAVGLIIGLLTEYYTSNAYSPVQELARSCSTGAATNIIYGLALGYLSCIIPVILLAVAAFVSHKLLGLFGIALAALGMLSNLCIGLAVDAYGPISDNAGGIAEMSHLGENVRKSTDALDAAGNTTAAIGKGFAIGSAALVSLSLYGAYIVRASAPPLSALNGGDPAFIISDVEITDALLFSGLLVGAMLPYAFSAMTMKSVGQAAIEMANEVKRQLAENPGIKDGSVTPDYQRCIEISTKASLKEMVGPGALVILTPVLVGFLFGPRAVAGLLPGALVSGVQMAISASNTGGAWDNAKKYIESGKLKNEHGEVQQKGSEAHVSAVIGDTVGDPLKDTSGPSLNILIKLSAILSLVFAPFFQFTGVLVCALGENTATEGTGVRTCA